MLPYKYLTTPYQVICFVGVMLLGCHGEESEFVIRKTVYGKIKGFISERVKGYPVENYLGVPYAAPPVGDLRFEYPQDPPRWTGVRDTLTLPAACPQRVDFSYIQMHKNFTIENEDCLYLNVYIPKHDNKTQNKFPILLYIHGGSNEVGMGAMFDGDVLAGFGQIIVITFNYRLGALGFIGAREEGLKGNYGFLDQVYAMKWVRKNIHEFNGDPSMVTIDGHSAGAADVGFHVVSPMSKGLFRYAVIQSGSPLAFWAMSRPEWRPGYNINDCKNERDSCSVESNIPYKQYLKSLSTDVIKNIPGKPTPANLIAFPAIVDEEFLTDRPENILNTGNFNGESYLLSFTRDEGSQHAAISMSRENVNTAQFSISAEVLLDHYNGVFNETQFRDILNLYKPAFPGVCGLTDIILHEYNGWDLLPNITSSLIRYIEMESDFVFVAPMIHMANMMSNWTKNLFVFSFDHQSSLAPPPNWLGVPHGRDMFYLFGCPLVGHEIYKYSDLDILASKYMMTMWSNFVKFGYLSLNGVNYTRYNIPNKVFTRLYLDRDITVKESFNFKPRKMAFWNQFLPLLDRTPCRTTCNAGCSITRPYRVIMVLISCCLLAFKR